MTPGQKCETCNTEFIFDQANTVVYWFENSPWFSYARSYCPKCETLCITFMRDTYAECMEYFVKQDVGFISDQDPPDEIVAGFERTYDVHPETEVELTARMELELQNLHVVLENIPDELLLNMFETPEPPHERPERWC